MYRAVLSTFLIITLVFQPFATLWAQSAAEPQAADDTPPSILHEPISEAFPHGQAFDLKATVTDDSGIEEVRLYYRVKGNANYKSVPMSRIEGSDEYLARIPEHDVWGPSFQYYIRATDKAGNALQRGLDFSPMKIDLTSSRPQPPPAAPAPVSKPKSSVWKWVLVGVGVAAVAGLAAALGGGGGNGGEPQPAGTVSIVADPPE